MRAENGLGAAEPGVGQGVVQSRAVGEFKLGEHLALIRPGKYGQGDGAVRKNASCLAANGRVTVGFDSLGAWTSLTRRGRLRN